MSKLTITACVFLILSVAGTITYNMIGSTVDADGFLHEPFGLIPLSYLAALIGFVLLGLSLARHIRTRA